MSRKTKGSIFFSAALIILCCMVVYASILEENHRAVRINSQPHAGEVWTHVINDFETDTVLVDATTKRYVKYWYLKDSTVFGTFWVQKMESFEDTNEWRFLFKDKRAFDSIYERVHCFDGWRWEGDVLVDSATHDSVIIINPKTVIKYIRHE